MSCGAQALAALNPDGVVMCYRAGCERTLRIFHEVNWLPAAVATLQCVDTPTTLAETSTVADYAKYFMGASQWDYRLTVRLFLLAAGSVVSA